MINIQTRLEINNGGGVIRPSSRQQNTTYTTNTPVTRYLVSE